MQFPYIDVCPGDDTENGPCAFTTGEHAQTALGMEFIRWMQNEFNAMPGIGFQGAAWIGLSAPIAPAIGKILSFAIMAASENPAWAADVSRVLRHSFEMAKLTASDEDIAKYESFGGAVGLSHYWVEHCPVKPRDG